MNKIYFNGPINKDNVAFLKEMLLFMLKGKWFTTVHIIEGSEYNPTIETHVRLNNTFPGDCIEILDTTGKENPIVGLYVHAHDGVIAVPFTDFGDTTKLTFGSVVAQDKRITFSYFNDGKKNSLTFAIEGDVTD